MNEPEKYFTKDVLEKIDEQAQKNDSSDANKRYVYVQRDHAQTILVVYLKVSKDVIYKYGKVQFANAEQPDGNLPLQFQWTY